MKTSLLRSLPSRVSAGLLLLLAGSVPALGQMDPNRPDTNRPPAADRTPADGSTATARELDRADQGFFTKATRLGEKEVALSRVVEGRALHAPVREFAAEMVRAHTAANEELAALAARKGAEFKGEDRTEIRGEEKKWNEKKGDEIDEDYLEAMIDCHQETVDVLEKGAESKDADIVAYANKTLPTVRTHLARAKALKEQVDKMD